jgi:dolichol-phosphate mannosyltransferase
LREIYAELSPRLNIGFIICEDGSKDNTKEILRALAEELPLRLNLSDDRKGYSMAICEGIYMLKADYLLCLDSDGQCDPKDFWEFWEARQGEDIVRGWRVKRADDFVRLALSRFFFLIYQAAFRVPMRDPSCPFVLMTKSAASRLVNELGAMQQGFWWEFVARAYRHGLKIKELPVNHRLRKAGVTQVYHWRKMPGIFVRHVVAIGRVWRETKR